MSKSLESVRLQFNFVNMFFTKNMFAGIPVQKLAIFFALGTIMLLSDGLFVLSIPFAFLGKSLLLLVFSWYVACAIMNQIINKNNLIGKVNQRAVFITGCDHGFGHLTALRFNELGFHVIATCLNSKGDGASKLIQGCRNNQRMYVMQLDVVDQIQLDQVVKQVRQLLSENQLMLHAVVNNAGIAAAVPAEYSSFEHNYAQVLAVNLFGPVHVTRRLLPLIRQSRKKLDMEDQSARVINICSAASTYHVSPIASYCMSKAGLLAFTNVLRQELDHLNILSVSIEPMAFATEITSVSSGIKNITKALNETESEVLHAYGNEFSKTRLFVHDQNFVSKKVHLVVDSIVDAAMAIQPEMRYLVAEPVDKVWVIGLSFLPVEFLYVLLKFARFLIRAYVRLFRRFPKEEEINRIHAEKEKQLS